MKYIGSSAVTSRTFSEEDSRKAMGFVDEAVQIAFIAWKQSGNSRGFKFVNTCPKFYTTLSNMFPAIFRNFSMLCHVHIEKQVTGTLKFLH